MRLQSRAETRVPASLANLLDLLDAGGELEPLLAPGLMDQRRWAGRGKNGAEKHVAIEDDEHYFCRAQASASSTISSISSGVLDAFSCLIA